MAYTKSSSGYRYEVIDRIDLKTLSEYVDIDQFRCECLEALTEGDELIGILNASEIE